MFFASAADRSFIPSVRSPMLEGRRLSRFSRRTIRLPFRFVASLFPHPPSFRLEVSTYRTESPPFFFLCISSFIISYTPGNPLQSRPNPPHRRSLHLLRLLLTSQQALHVHTSSIFFPSTQPELTSLPSCFVLSCSFSFPGPSTSLPSTSRTGKVEQEESRSSSLLLRPVDLSRLPLRGSKGWSGNEERWVGSGLERDV